MKETAFNRSDIANNSACRMKHAGVFTGINMKPKRIATVIDSEIPTEQNRPENTITKIGRLLDSIGEDSTQQSLSAVRAAKAELLAIH